MPSMKRKLLYALVILALVISLVPHPLTAWAAPSELYLDVPPQVQPPDPEAWIRGLLGDDPQSEALATMLNGLVVGEPSQDQELPGHLPLTTPPLPEQPVPPTPVPSRPQLRPDVAQLLQWGRTPLRMPTTDEGAEPVPQPELAARTGPAKEGLGSSFGRGLDDNLSASRPAEEKPAGKATSQAAHSSPYPAAAPRSQVVFLPLVTRNCAPDTESVFLPPNRLTVTSFHGGRLTVAVPAGTVEQLAILSFRPLSIQPIEGHPHVLFSFELTGRVGDEPLSRLRLPIGLSTTYEDRPGLDESRLQLYYLDKERGVWTALPTTVTADRNVALAAVNHLSTFALMDVGSCEEIDWAPIPPDVQPIFLQACNRVGLGTLGQPAGTAYQSGGSWIQEFEQGALVQNPAAGVAYYLQLPLWDRYEQVGGPGSWLGCPTADTNPNGPPDTYRDEKHDFRNQPYCTFEHGFIGINEGGGVCAVEAHRYYPQVLTVYKQGEQVQVGEDPYGNPIYEVKLTLSAALEPAPESQDGAQAEAKVWVEFGSDREDWQDSAIVGAVSQQFEYPELLPLTETLVFHWSLDRGASDSEDDLIGYAPCVYYDHLTPYGPFAAAGDYETKVDCSGGGSGDYVPPSITFIEVWPDGNRNLSILVSITDDSGQIASYSISGGPGELSLPLTYMPEFGANIYGAVFSNIPDNQVVNFTVTASDPSGNSASASGSSRSPFSLRFGFGCRIGQCGGYDAAVGNPIMLGPGNKVEQLPVMSVAGPGGSSIEIVLTYNGQDSHVGIAGQGWTFPYQMTLEFYANPLLIGAQVVYPDGRVLTFSDNGDGTFSPTTPGVRDRLERRGDNCVLITKELSEYEFDAAGHLILFRDRNGNTIRFLYAGDLLTRIENSANRWVNITYDGQGLIVALGAPEGKHCELGYTGTRLTSFTDPRGQVWRFEYEERSIGKLLDVHGQPYDAYDYYLTGVVTPKGHYKNQQRYDERGRPVEQWVGGREHRTYTYDEEARVTTVTDAYGNITVYRYDDLWRLVQIDYPDGTGEVFGYDDNSNRTYYRDRGGREWRWTYDERGNRLTEDGPLGWHRTWQYNGMDRVVRQAERVNAHTTRETTFTYDGRGNLTGVCNALGLCSTTQYDERGLPTDIYDFANHHTHSSYDAEGDLVSITNAEGETTLLGHDELGRMVERITPLGHLYTYTYDPGDNLLAVDGPLGYHLEYHYDDNGNLDGETDPNGGAVHYTYDTAEKITSVENQLGFVIASYSYGGMNEMTGFQDAEGRTWSYRYDVMLRPTDTYGPLDTHTNYRYDAAGNLTDVTDPVGCVTHTDYDALDRPVSITLNYRPGEPATADTNVTTTYEYDLLSNVLRKVDPEGNATTYQYDLLGRMTLLSDAEGQAWRYQYDPMGHLVQVINPRGFATSWEYDGVYRLVKIIDARGNVTAFSFDDDGNMTDEVDPLLVVTHYDYDELGRLIRQVRNYRPGEPADAQTNVTTAYEYDLAGNPRFITDPRGYRSECRYDAAGRVTDTFDYEGAHTHLDYDRVGNLLSVTDDNGHATSYRYDDLNRRTAVINAEGDGVYFTYDPAGHLTDMVDGNGSPTHYDLDALGRVTHTVNALGGEWSYQYNRVGKVLVETDANAHSRTFTYDRVYRLLSTTDAEGYITGFRWDENGNLAERIDGNGHSTYYHYDELDRLDSTTNAEGETTAYRYDPLGNQTELVEADGTVTLYGYDPLYRLVAVTQNYRPGAPQNNDTNVVTRYLYDPSGNLAQVVNANGATTYFEHDGMGRLTREVDPLGHTWVYTYDGVGNRLSRQDANGAITLYAYYPDDQLRRIDYPDGTLIEYTYDHTNLLTSMRDPLGTTTWTHDALGRVTDVVDALNRDLHYRYDPVGNRLEIIYPDGNRVAYTYYANDWIKTMVDPVGNETSYEHDGVGSLTRIQNPNSTVVDVTYDKVNRILTLRNYQTEGAQTTNSAFSYSYDEVGSVVQVVSEYGWRQPAVITETFSYDGLHRLAGMQDSEGVITAYTYDAVGNRKSWATNDDPTTQTPFDGFVATYEYNADDQLLTARIDSTKPNGDVTIEFAYDNNGSRTGKLATSENGPSYGTDYRYSWENELILAQDYQLVDHDRRVDRAITTLNYDGSGRRLVQKYDPKVGGGGQKSIEYVFDGLDPVAEYDMLNGQRDNFYRGALGYIATMHHFPAGAEGQMYWYHYNSKGDVVGLTKQHGQSTHNYRYDPYGLVIPAHGNFIDPHNHYTLTGKEYDENTSLLYFGSRHYDPTTATWMTPDSYRGTSRLPQSMHRYSYVYGNPVTYYDPYGHWPQFLDNAVEAVSDAVSGVAEAVSDAAAEAGQWVSEHQDTIAKVAIGVVATAGTVGLCVATGGIGCIVAGAVIAGASSYANQVVDNAAENGKLNFGKEGVFTDIDWKEVALSTAVGAVSGIVAGGVGGQLAKVCTSGPWCAMLIGGAAGAVGGMTGQFLTNVFDGNPCTGWFDGVWQAGLAGGVMGGAMSGTIYGVKSFLAGPKSGKTLVLPKEKAQNLETYQKAAAEGKLEKVEVHRLNNTKARYEASTGEKVNSKIYDVDHVIELQLGGADDVSNMQLLESSPNRASGSKIRAQIADDPIGTKYTNVVLEGQPQVPATSANLSWSSGNAPVYYPGLTWSVQDEGSN